MDSDLRLNRRHISFTSDWHIGHANCIKFDERPFDDLSHMHEILIIRYNACVPENGICYFLGDMGNRPEEIRKVMSRLNGTKVLIIGNHDKGVNTMYNCGFDVVLFSASLMIDKERVTMSHCPLMGVFREDTSKMKKHDPDNPENWHGEHRRKHQNCSLLDEGHFHLHGHIHSRKNKKQSKKILGKQYDVGVTANKYAPVSMSQIESWVSNYKKSEDLK